MDKKIRVEFFNQKRLFVACPHCKEQQYIDYIPTAASYVCGLCHETFYAAVIRDFHAVTARKNNTLLRTQQTILFVRRIDESYVVVSEEKHQGSPNNERKDNS